MVFNQKSGWFVATEEQAAVIRNYILTCVQWKNWHKIKITPDVCDGVYSKLTFHLILLQIYLGKCDRR